MFLKYLFVLMLSGFAYASADVSQVENEARVLGVKSIISVLSSPEMQNEMRLFAIENKDVRDVNELMEKLYAFINKTLGPKIGSIVIYLSGFKAMQEHILNLYNHIVMINSDEDCEEGLRKSVSDLIWIGASAMLYNKLSVVTGTVASLASYVSSLAIVVTNADGTFCKLIGHREFDLR